jgi:hypothetical protein
MLKRFVKIPRCLRWLQTIDNGLEKITNRDGDPLLKQTLKVVICGLT